jgi:Ser/Thr protein kinase RdoA (MazF antagonist)
VNVSSGSARARDLLDDSALEYVTHVGTRLDQMTGLSVVTCHLDYTQRNWVVDDGGRLGVIDFSTCGRAPVAEDLSRLAHRQWTTRPDLRDAFFAGYGRALDDDERAQLECSTALAALADLASASALGRQALVAPAQRTLRHLRETSDLSPPTRATSRVRRSPG